MTSVLPEDADFSMCTDKSATQFSDSPFNQCLDLMLAHLDARMLADYAILGVYEMLVVKTDGGAKDKAKVKVLSDHGRRALHLYLDVPIKSKHEDNGSSAKRPTADSDAASSATILQRLLGLRVDDAGQDTTSRRLLVVLSSRAGCMRCSGARRRPSSKIELSWRTSSRT